jgi:hypothetical protein
MVTCLVAADKHDTQSVVGQRSTDPLPPAAAPRR